MAFLKCKEEKEMLNSERLASLVAIYLLHCLSFWLRCFLGACFVEENFDSMQNNGNLMDAIPPTVIKVMMCA